MKCLEATRRRALKSYLGLVAALPPLDADGRAELEVRARLGDLGAVRALTESYLGAVVAEANALRGRGRRFEALIAVGNRALAQALRAGWSGERVLSHVRARLSAWVASPR